MDKFWSVTDTALGARSIQENVELSSLPKSKKKYNVTRLPLFPTIPLQNVVIDNLHLFLRVALIVELRKEDLMEKRKSTAYDPQKCKNLENFRKFITELGIPGYNFWIGETSKQLKWRTLTGPEKLKVFKHINIQQLLPNSPECRTIKIQVLWTELLELNTMFSKGPEAITDADINDFETRSREWVDKFIHEYQTKNVTPYIHAMSNHVGEFTVAYFHLLSKALKNLMTS